MKKTVYLFAAGLISLTACNNEPSYRISGKTEGIADSTVVYLQKAQGRNLVKLDSAMVINGAFTFSGRQDTTIHRYISCTSEGTRYKTDFFLENGQIRLTMGKENTISGTPSNDAYQAFKNEFNCVISEINDIYKTLRTDSTITEAQREELMKKFNELSIKSIETVYSHSDLNVNNKVGEYIFANHSSYLSTERQKALLSKMPAEALKNHTIERIAKHIEVLDKTAVGQKFIDFEMPAPDGKTLKISDIISQNKYTLIDFWASWCGPCRTEMPNVIAAYNEYHKKGFDIIGISLDGSAEDWKKAIKEWKMPWIHISDLKATSNEAALLYGIQSIPSTLLIAQDGTIVARNLRGENIKEKLAELLK